jgi:hypothetical protein
MVDIRQTRRESSEVWIWVGLLAVVGMIVWGAAGILGDPTARDDERGVGAAAAFGADRAAVLPIAPIPFSEIDPVDDRFVGRLVRLQGTAETPVRRGATWVRTTDGRRILVRFEPRPPEDAPPPVTGGGRVDLNGYLQTISRAEIQTWTRDSLNVSLPRPRPAGRFGLPPEEDFLRLDALFIRDYYISVRPQRALQDQIATED